MITMKNQLKSHSVDAVMFVRRNLFKSGITSRLSDASSCHNILTIVLLCFKICVMIRD